jgi:hypothetical protein
MSRPQPIFRKTFAHGVRGRYQQGCRCSLCRTANCVYKRTRQQAVVAGTWNVPPTKTRNHIKRLRAEGVGIRTIARLTGTRRNFLQSLINGERVRLSAERSDAILALTVKAAQKTQLGCRIPAGPTWKLVERLRALGWTKGEIARTALGVKGDALQLRKDFVSRDSANAIAAFWRIVRDEQKKTDICVDCGYSHQPEDRQRIVARMKGADPMDIAEAWPCFYGPRDHEHDLEWRHTAGYRSLMRDLACLRSKGSPTLKKDRNCLGGGGGVRGWISGAGAHP